MKPRYYYPQDIKVEVVNSERVASVDFSLPILWSDDAIRMASFDYMSGWEMARRNHENAEHKRFLERAEIVSSFWNAHRANNYDPLNPKWTVSEWDITMKDIMAWAQATTE